MTTPSTCSHPASPTSNTGSPNTHPATTRTSRPGVVTRARRDDRRHLEHLTGHVHQLEAAQQDRNEWITQHADTFDHRDQLRAQVDQRRRTLGEIAAQSVPAHVVDLIGEPPTDQYLEHWVNSAGRIESYREEWRLRPDQLLDRPDDHAQATAWARTIKPALDTRRLEERLIQHRARPTDREAPGIEL